MAAGRWIEHWKTERLADHFAVNPIAKGLRTIKKRPIDIGIPISSKIIREQSGQILLEIFKK